MTKTGIALALLAINPWGASSAKADDWTKQWMVTDAPEMRIRTGDVSIVVEGGEGREISASLRTRGLPLGPNGLKISEHQEGSNSVSLEIRDPISHFSFMQQSAELHLRVPPKTAVDIQTGDGSIRLDGLAGRLRLGTGDGSISGMNLGGKMDVTTGDGSVHLKGQFDGLRIKTADGSVDVQTMTGSHLTEDWRIQTGDGSVRLTIPKDLAAELRIHTGDGSIAAALPMEMKHQRTDHELQGTLNGGGSLLDIRTGDGSVHIGAT